MLSHAVAAAYPTRVDTATSNADRIARSRSCLRFAFHLAKRLNINHKTSSEPVNRLVIYVPKAGKLADLEAIVKRHGGVLRQTGLLTDEPVRVYRGTDIRKPDAGTFLVEQFQWRDGGAADLAHQSPEVMAVWETMGPHIETMTLTTLEAIK